MVNNCVFFRLQKYYKYEYLFSFKIKYLLKEFLFDFMH